MTIFQQTFSSNFYNYFINSIELSNKKKIVKVPSTTSEGTLYPIREQMAQYIHNNNQKTTLYNRNTFENTLNKNMKIYTIKLPSNYNTITSMVTKIVESTPNLYGITLVLPTDIKYNLLHPLTDFTIVKNELITNNNQIKLFIYTSSTITNTLEDIEDITFYKEKIAKDITAIHKSKYIRQHKIANSTELTVSGNSFNSQTLSQSSFITNIKDTIIKFKEDEYIWTLVPHYFISEGIHFPYYSYTLIKETTDEKTAIALNLPMVSPNIGKSVGTNASICTGSAPSDKYDSLRVLNDCNLGSPFFKGIIHSKYVSAWVKANIEIALFQLQQGVTDE